MYQEPEAWRMQDAANRPLRLLSLDGGGVRGLSALIILGRIMHRIKVDLKLAYEPLPCEYFDLIGGTSTGGIIAVLLGRLRLSVDECIDIYTDLSRQIFAIERCGQGIWQDRYDHTILERLIKERLVYLQRERGGTTRSEARPASMTQGAHELMEDDHPDICRTFVTATWKHDVQIDNPVLFRTYPGRGVLTQPSPMCEIWKALRATSAAPTFFGSIDIDKVGYVDGGFGCNNPTRTVYEEAGRLWPNRQIGCIVSIGTGVPKVQSIPTTRFSFILWLLSAEFLAVGWFHAFQMLVLGWLDILQRVITDCNTVHEDMIRDFKGQGKYFRFNVQQGAQNISLDAWKRMGELSTHTEVYLSYEETKRKLNNVVKLLEEL